MSCYFLLQWITFFQNSSLGFPGGSDGKESACNAGFKPWVARIPWRRAWKPTPVFLHGESPWTEEPGRYSVIESDVTKHSTAHFLC